MNIREEINKVLDNLPEESLEAALEYARFIQGLKRLSLPKQK